MAWYGARLQQMPEDRLSYEIRGALSDTFNEDELQHLKNLKENVVNVKNKILECVYSVVPNAGFGMTDANEILAYELKKDLFFECVEYVEEMINLNICSSNFGKFYIVYLRHILYNERHRYRGDLCLICKINSL